MTTIHNDASFYSLLKENDCKRWNPKSVQSFRNALKINTSVEHGWLIYNNFGYNMQYLEYLQKQINELNFYSEVIPMMIYKNYIIYAMSIIEALFANLLRSEGLWNQTEWKLVGKNPMQNSKEFKVGDEKLKMQSEMYKKIDKIDESMNLDSIIKKVESNGLINLSPGMFKILSYFRKLRNKIHIYSNEDGLTDYNTFKKIDQLKMRFVLYNILTNDKFLNSSADYLETYDFIKLTDDEFKIMSKKNFC